jgi:branched-chain amino acid aminotransferase
MTPIVYFNGVFIPEPEAHVAVDDGGWLHGAGLFETMRAQHGRVFRLDAHHVRLERSAATLLGANDLGVLPDPEAYAELLDRNRLESARIRLTVAAGSMRSGLGAVVPSFTVCATAAPLAAPLPGLYAKGVVVALCDHRVSPSDPIAGHKTTCYLPRLVGLRRAREAQCFDALWFTTANRLAEGSITNVFVAKDGVLKTPSLDTPVLPGIARSVVLELAGTLETKVEETALTVNDLLDADEVLLTNSIIQVMPVIRVERHDIREGRVGPLAGRLLEAYRAYVAKECGR